MIVASPGGIFRLHRAGRYGCWMGRKRASRSAPVLYCNGASDNLRYDSSCGLMPVREMYGFEGPEVPPESAMETGAAGGTPPPVSPGKLP